MDFRRGSSRLFDAMKAVLREACFGTLKFRSSVYVSYICYISQNLGRKLRRKKNREGRIQHLFGVQIVVVF